MPGGSGIPDEDEIFRKLLPKDKGMKHILTVARTGGINETFQIVTSDKSTQAEAMNFVDAVKKGDIFLGRIARTVYRNNTYEWVVAEKEIPVGFNKKYIVSVMIETPEDHVKRIIEGLF